MNNYIPYNEELYHYGVRGMKWGVRKEEYITDKKKRKALTSEAIRSGILVNEYNKLSKKDTLSIVRKIDKDLKKDNKMSDKTKLAIERNLALQKDKVEAIKQLNYNIENLQNHVNKMIKKYGDTKISDVSYYVKNGQKFVKGFAFIDGVPSIEKRTYINPDGTETSRYTKVITRYY